MRATILDPSIQSPETHRGAAAAETGAGDSPSCACVCAADEGYALPLAVMLESLLANTPNDVQLRVCVVDCGLSERSRIRLSSLAAGRAQLDLQDSVRSSELPDPAWGHVTGATYERLLLDHYVPEGTRRAAWLDADLLVLGDVGPLLRTDTGGAVLSAVRDPFVPRVSSAFGVRDWRRLGLASETPYFNAGVMVVDMDGWRGLDVVRRSLAYLRRYGRSVFFNEQEALNVVVGGAWAQLDDRWNFSANPMHARRQRPGNGGPAILHFAGRIKPWAVPNLGEGQDIWFQHLDNTPWRGERPRHTSANRLLSWYLRSRLRRSTWWLENQQLRLRHFLGI